MSPDGTALLEARAVAKVYRAGTREEVRALDEVTLTIPARAFCVLTGPSGSGKTTLLALLGALERPTRGQVFFAGRDLAACAEAERARLRRRMGFVFQDGALIPGLPVWENLTYPLVPKGAARAERLRLARERLAEFGLADKALRRPAELSGGEQQRVALLRALIAGPEVLLADEPTAHLDDATATATAAYLQRAHATGMTVVVASHDPRFLPLGTLPVTLQGGRVLTG